MRWNLADEASTGDSGPCSACGAPEAGAWLLGNVDFQLSPVDSFVRDFFGNEAERLLKIKGKLWNEPKRSQEKPFALM
jgi:hypothetical protein